MFTGVIENLGDILSLSPTPSGARLGVDIGPMAREVKPGGSVAVNGVCLSATRIDATAIEFDVVFETLSRTNLGELTRGQSVNIELPLRASDRLEGHFVQGHVDTTCRIAEWRDQGAGRLLTLELDDADCEKYIIPKGSVALDGISLTVASVAGRRFTIAVIPTTLARTTLIHKPVGARINFEADILVKTVVAMHERMAGSDESLMAHLRRSGFAL